MARWNRPWLWLLFFGAAALALTAASRAFSQAFPIVSLEVEADREAVRATARERADSEGWETEGYRTAVSFGLRDPQAKTYVELEGGGREAWQELVTARDHTPYVWTVRLFRPGETTEARVRIAPDGRPVGFRLRLPDDAPGASLSPDSARALAEAGAVGRWGVDLEPFRFVSRAQEERAGGRVDHEFVYERADATVGEARFRLHLDVAGDRLVGIQRVIEVPESFTRRYREMRSANDLVAFGATLAAGLLYVLLGCGVGLLWLLRTGSARWRPAVVAAGIVSTALAAERLNRIPLSWMGYDTAVSRGDFLAGEIGAAMLTFGGALLLLTLVFTVGEGLVRRAFGDQPRLWASWGRGAAESDALLGRSLGGYLYPAFAIPYVIGFYLLTTRHLRWWTPAEALVEPDLLATPLPWLSAVATALFAATNEELLFRAVPLAGAALLGERLGRRRLWVGGALLLQAVIFAAAHANYPQQPAYARFVELLVPALAFGLLVLRFGLVPAILGHFLFNLVWMSLPLFTASAPGIGLDQGVVVAAGLAPLTVVVWARLRRGAGTELPERLRNRSDEGEGRKVETGDGKAADGKEAEGARELSGSSPLASPSFRILLPLGLGGLVAWGMAFDPGREAPSLQLTRAQAIERARELFRAQGAPEGDPWREVARVRVQRGAQHRFVWEEHGAEAYRGLLGGYLAGPRWVVRKIRFEGTVEERAEQWRAEIDGRGRVQRLTHRLPEDAAGDTLPEMEGRGLARRALLRRFRISAPRTEEVSAEAEQRPHRRDWTYTFRDLLVDLEPGEARMEVRIAGSQPVDARLFVHVPEDWVRRDRARTTREEIRRLAAGSLLVLLGVLTAGYAVVRWGRGNLPVQAFLGVGGVAFGLYLLDLGNRVHETTASFVTDQPFGHQLAFAWGGGIFTALLGAGLLGLLAGLAHGVERRGSVGSAPALGAGACVGFLVAGGLSVLGLLDPARLPPWPDYGAADALLPWLEDPLQGGIALLATGALGLAGLFALQRLSARWNAPIAVPAAASLLLGFAFAGVGPVPTSGTWIVAGLGLALLLGVVHFACARWGLALVPGLVAVPLLMGAGIRAWIAPEPGSRVGALLTLVVVAGGASLWARVLARPSGEEAPGA